MRSKPAEAGGWATTRADGIEFVSSGLRVAGFSFDFSGAIANARSMAPFLPDAVLRNLGHWARCLPCMSGGIPEGDEEEGKSEGLPDWNKCGPGVHPSHRTSLGGGDMCESTRVATRVAHKRQPPQQQHNR